MKKLEGSHPLALICSVCFYSSASGWGIAHEAARFFDFKERLTRLSGLEDQLEAFSQTIQ